MMMDVLCIVRLFNRAVENLLYFDYLDRLNNIQSETRKADKYRMVVFIVFPLLLTKYALQSFYYLISSRKQNQISDIVFIGTSPALKRVATQANLLYTECMWFPIPFETIEGIEHNKQYNPFSFCSGGDIFRSLLASLIVYYSLVFKRGIRVGVKALDCYKQILLFSMLSRFRHNTKFFFCNHKDIWAIIIDNLPYGQKNLIQHGTEIVINNNKIPEPILLFNEKNKIWTQNVPVKLCSVDNIFAFSEVEAAAMQQALLDCSPKVTVVGYGLSLTELRENSNRKAVLIIGFYKDYWREEQSVLDVLQSLDINVYLKNHPAIPQERYNDFKKLYRFDLINEPVFPVVDLVISYRSTLALQYESVGCKVLYYDEIDFSNFKDRVSELL